MSDSFRGTVSLFVLFVLLFAAGCATTRRTPQRPAETGPRWGLVPCENPPGLDAYKSIVRNRGDTVLRALDRSLEFFNDSSSRRLFPVGPLSHRRARESLLALRELLQNSANPGKAARILDREFSCFKPRGVPAGGVHFTGYFSPVYPARREATASCSFPLYRKPTDLAVNPTTGKVLGRPVLGGWLGHRSYPTREQLETTDRLRGRELVYLCNRLDQYFAHIQGSAKLVFPDGRSMYVGYAASNGRRYVSIGKRIRRRADPPMKLTIPGIRKFFRQNPDTINSYLRQNPRFIFFRRVNPDQWPSGSLNVQLTPMHSLATASHWFPPGAPVLVQSPLSNGSGEFTERTLLMFNQDTGGAFRTRDRADIYFGRGRKAGTRAGRQSGRGSMRFLLLKGDGA